MRDAAALPPCLNGGGEMGARIRAHDWAATPLGPPQAWPRSLQTAVGLMLSGRQPVYIAWGEAGLSLYNDAYLPILGRKHPASLGRPVAEIWEDVWADVGPMLQAVRQGTAQELVDHEFALTGRDGAGTSYFSGTYLPLRDDEDRVAGIFVTVIETTERVRAERQTRFLADLTEGLRVGRTPQAVLSRAARTLGPYLGVGRCGYTEIDETTELVTAHEEWNDGSLPSFVGSFQLASFGEAIAGALRAGETVVLGDSQTDGRTAGPDAPSFVATDLRAGLAVPLLKDGRFVAALYVHQSTPRVWLPEEVELVRAVAERTWAAMERARAENALRAREEQLRLATEFAEVGFWDVDMVSGTLFWPPLVRRMFGIGPDGPVSMEAHFYAGLHPADRERVTAAFAAAADPAQRALYDVEYRTVGLTDGVERWVAAKGRGLFDAHGQCLRVLGTAIDITARKAAEQTLQRTETSLSEALATLDALMAHSPVGFAFFDSAHRYVRINTVLADINGLQVEAHLGKRIEELLPVNARAVVPVLDAVFATGRPLETVEIGGETPARPGERRHWLTSFFPVKEANGTVAYVGATVIDITARRRAEEALRRLNEGLEAQVAARTAERDRVWRNSRDLLVLVGMDGVFRAVSPAWTRILGHAVEDVVGRHFTDFTWSEDEAVLQRALETALGSQDLTNFDTRFRHADGTVRWISWNTSAEGDVVYGYGRDVTEEKAKDEALARAEAALRQAQKMEAVGQLTGGIAHDFNNLLQGVAGNLDLIRRRPDDRERVRRWAEAGLSAAERGAKLTGQLLAFSRAQKLELKPLCLTSLVRNMQDLLVRTLGPAIAIWLDLGEQPVAVLGDEVQLEMALLNLAINARDAMPSGGDLVVAIRVVEGSLDLAPAEEMEAEWPHAGFVELSVRDTGQGMPPEVAARAFDPFFTTKGVGKGTGLGLSQVYGMTRQAGGDARIESTPGAGTVVRLFLRRSEAAAVAAEAPDGVAQPAALRRTVLVTDDDADVRRFLTDSLHALGYRVLAASDGMGALAMLREDTASAIDAMVLDFAMPGLNGAETLVAARAIRPDLPVVFASGFAETEAIERAAGKEVVILRKPFRIDELASAVGTALSSPGSGAALGVAGGGAAAQLGLAVREVAAPEE